MHLARRVDGPQALGHDLGLGAADIALLGMQLTVGIADADIIEVEQGDFAHAATGHGFGRPGADPADTDDGYVGLAQALQAVVTVQPGDTGKAWIFCTHGPTPKKPARIIGLLRRDGTLLYPPPESCIGKGSCNPALMSHAIQRLGRQKYGLRTSAPEANPIFCHRPVLTLPGQDARRIRALRRPPVPPFGTRTIYVIA
ncbi:hypothetical protein D3C77_557520 [compost metagenome]